MNQDQVLSIVRTILKIGGTYAVAHGVADSVAAEAITGGVLALIGVVWSLVTHKSSAPAR